MVPVPSQANERIPAVVTARPRQGNYLLRKDSGMFGTLAATAALAFAPSQAGTLTLTNVRTTYGEMGAIRTDNRYLPQDFYFLAFDMEGLTVSPERQVSYTMMVEVTNKAGQPL